MQTGNTNYIYKNDLDKACFQHGMAWGKYKDLTKRTESDKDLRNQVFKIASNPKYDGYQRWLASMVCNFFDKKSTDELSNFQMNLINQLLENVKEEQFILYLMTISGVLI